MIKPPMHFNESDESLRTLLSRATDDELQPLLDCILGPGRQGRLSSDLDPHYENDPTHPSRYWKVIGTEIQCYGGATAANLLRGHGVTYTEILADVAAKLGIAVAEKTPRRMVEAQIHAKLFSTLWETLDFPARKEALKACAELGSLSPAQDGQTVYALLPAILEKSPAACLQVMQTVVGTMWADLFQPDWPNRSTYVTDVCVSTLSLIKALTGVQKWIQGRNRWFPGWGLDPVMDVWCNPIGKLTQPAYHVTIPAVAYLALLRRLQRKRLATEG